MAGRKSWHGKIVPGQTKIFCLAGEAGSLPRPKKVARYGRPEDLFSP